MKKTETLKTKERIIKSKVKKVTKTYCDFCSTVIPDYGSFGWWPSCSLCGRDTCRKHNKSDPNEFGDYTDWYCSICYKLKFDKYVGTFEEIESCYHEDLDRLEQQIKEESLESPIS